MDRAKIEQFYARWKLTLPQRIEGYIYDEERELLPQRFIFNKFKEAVEKLLTGKLTDIEKIILIPGIRGIGKSTLLAQTYMLEKFLAPEDKNIIGNIGKLDDRIYLDVSQLHAEQISLHDFFIFYEEINGFHFEKPGRKLLFLLDEIHFDENWGLFLKNIYDRTKGHKDVLFLVTGSSALQIKMIADLGRRSDVWEFYPMTFDEYILLKYNKSCLSDLSSYIRDILFKSLNASEVFKLLFEKKKEIDGYFANEIPHMAEKDFFEFGSFPFTLKINNKQKAAEKIKSVIDGIIAKDIIILKNFKTHTIAKISDLLYLLAQSDLISYNKIQATLRISRAETLESLVEVLVLSGLVVKVKTYGTSYKSTRKTPKLLFITPSLRSAILNNNYPTGLEGKKLEDYFVLISQKIFMEKHAFKIGGLSYDIAEGGADFVLTLSDNSNIVIEVGFNKEKSSQVQNTMKKVKSRYGLVFGTSEIELVKDSIVKVPLKYLLMA